MNWFNVCAPQDFADRATNLFWHISQLTGSSPLLFFLNHILSVSMSFLTDLTIMCLGSCSMGSTTIIVLWGLLNALAHAQEFTLNLIFLGISQFGLSSLIVLKFVPVFCTALAVSHTRCMVPNACLSVQLPNGTITHRHSCVFMGVPKDLKFFFTLPSATCVLYCVGMHSVSKQRFWKSIFFNWRTFIDSNT